LDEGAWAVAVVRATAATQSDSESPACM
jgi:hypothetical protein